MRYGRMPTALLFGLLVLLAGLPGVAAGATTDREVGKAPPARRLESKAVRPARRENRPEVKIALGTVGSVDPKAGTLVLRPTQGEPMTFAINREPRSSWTTKGRSWKTFKKAS